MAWSKPTLLELTELLEKARIRRGMRKGPFAELLGIHLSQYSGMLHLRCRMPERAIPAVSRLLRLPKQRVAEMHRIHTWNVRTPKQYHYKYKHVRDRRITAAELRELAKRVQKSKRKNGLLLSQLLTRPYRRKK